jgi:hypothetical protein
LHVAGVTWTGLAQLGLELDAEEAVDKEGLSGGWHLIPVMILG